MWCGVFFFLGGFFFFFFFFRLFVCFVVIMCSVDNNGVRCFSLRLATPGNSWL